jgi:acyl-CoA dehydrogenase
MLAACLPAPLPVKLLRENGISAIGPVKVEDFDYTHTSIFLSEMMRLGLAGPASSLITGLAYGTPPLIEYASDKIRSELVPALLKGEKRICIAITEPDAGSDVAAIQATAVKSADGRHYIVNGSKKWITNGIFSDYASTCVRTGGDGPTGLSLLLVPLKGTKGVSIRRMHVSGRKCSGTSFIELDDVKVPVENLIGEPGKGMKYIMVTSD